MHFTIQDGTTLHQRKIANIPNIIRYFGAGKGPFTSLGGVEGLGFIKTKFTNHSDDWPDFEIHMVSGTPASDDGQTFRKVQGFTREFWSQYYQPKVHTESFSLYPVMLRPKSKGYIELRSPNPYEPPIIEPRYLTEEEDIQKMVDAMKVSFLDGVLLVEKTVLSLKLFFCFRSPLPSALRPATGNWAPNSLTLKCRAVSSTFSGRTSTLPVMPERTQPPCTTRSALREWDPEKILVLLWIRV